MKLRGLALVPCETYVLFIEHGGPPVRLSISQIGRKIGLPLHESHVGGPRFFPARPGGPEGLLEDEA